LIAASRVAEAARLVLHILSRIRPVVHQQDLFFHFLWWNLQGRGVMINKARNAEVHEDRRSRGQNG
jgi:hypothetical protein